MYSRLAALSKYFTTEERRVMSQTLKFVKLWDWVAYSERTR